MATVYGVEATKALNTTPAQFVDSADWNGRLRYQSDSYEAAAAAAGTDVIVGLLKKGAQIHPRSLIRFDDMGTGTTLDVLLRPVDGSADVSLVAGVDTATTAGVLDFGAIAYIDVFPHTVAEDSYVVVSLQDAASTGTLKSDIVFTD